MNAMTRELSELLLRKQELDIERVSSNNLVSYAAWMVDAFELLLRIELDRQGRRK